MYIVRAGVRENFKEEAIKLVGGGFSAIAGFGIGEFTAEYLVKVAKITDALQKFLIKSATRLGLGLIFAGLSWMTGGILAWILFAMAMGCIGGIFMDIIEYFKPGGFKAMAEQAALGSEGAGFGELAFEPEGFGVNEGGFVGETPMEMPMENKHGVAGALYS